MMSTFCECRSWLSSQMVSPSSTRPCSQPWPYGSALFRTCVPHSTAKPSFRMPPGFIVVSTPEITASGVIAARLGGCALATKSWLMPGNEIPIMPTCPAHGCVATVSMMS